MQNVYFRIIKDNEIKARIFDPNKKSVVVKSDGTVWVNDIPLLSAPPDQHNALRALSNAKQYDKIPTEYFIKLGENANGAWAGWDDEFSKHPLGIAKAELLKQQRETGTAKVETYQFTFIY